VTRTSRKARVERSEPDTGTPGPSAPPSGLVESRPPLELSHEVRFAVVMYGGVSLAIYINGATQELLRLVHATAPGKRGEENARPLEERPGQPGDTTWTYRKLAYLLADEDLRARYREQIKKARAPDERGRANPDALPAPAEDLAEQAMAAGEPLGLRFVVDILSGTSAGGINAVFLAKALANNQRLDQLKELWVSEGDLARLLNDAESLTGLGLPLQTPPQSLLNSQRMYAKILHALDGMDKAGESDPDPAAARFSLADELDLFVTVTDLKGVPQPLRLSDKLVYERRHRNVFHFQHVSAGGQPAGAGEVESHFVPRNNPFLAFAARCTSAFPFAFEPMCLSDIEDVRVTFKDYRRGARWYASADDWRRFFREHADPETDVPVDFTQRVFADGGYLDNKPFSYATEAMLRRSQDRLMVDRKLLYIEPNPAHPEDVRQDAQKPSAVANVKAATLDLPSYETIREDLEAVLQRNRLIWRVNGLLGDIEKDMLAYEEAYEQQGEQRHAFPVLPDRGWDRMALAGMIDEYGISYLPYRRLRISGVTDELARHIARLAGFDERSDHVIAIRYLIRDWRNRAYYDHREDHGDHEDQGSRDRACINEYLSDCDFRYRLRRLLFLRHELDGLQRLSAAAGKQAPDQDLGPLAELRRRLDPKKLRLRLGLQDGGAAAAGGATVEPELEPGDLPALAVIVRAFKKKIDRLHVELRRSAPDLWRRPPPPAPAPATGTDGAARADAGPHPIGNLLRAVDALEIERKHLDYILGVPWEIASRDTASSSHLLEFAGGDEAGYQKRIHDLFQGGQYGLTDLQRHLDELGEAVRECLSGVMSENKAQVMKLLEGETDLELPPEREPPAPGGQRRRGELVSLVRMCLRVYFEHFEHYDQIRFPILYDTDVGEADAVEVIRISPEDATSLIDERAEMKEIEGNEAQSRKPSGRRPRRKLAGTTLRNFGAFLDDSWRKNDIMWGRLDGAERLISALLPEPEDACIRAALITEAHMTILAAELPALDTTMARIRARTNAGEKFDAILQDVLKERREQDPCDDTNKAVAFDSIQRRDLYEYVKTEYTVDRDLDPQAVLRLMSRSTQVVGKMFENLARDYQVSGKAMVWIVRLGQFLWSLVEIAIPQSLMNLLFRHWVKLLYVVEVFFIALLSLLDVRGGIRFGWMLLGVTAVTHVAVLFLEDYMQPRTRRRLPRKKRRPSASTRWVWLANLWSRFTSTWSRWTRGWSRLLAKLLVAAVVLFAGVGIYLVLDLGVRDVISRILPGGDDGASETPPETPPETPADPATRPPRR
jgi:patatin-related protein